MQIIKDEHKEQLKKAWLEYIHELPDYLREEILNFQKGTKMKGMTLMDQEAIVCERDYLKKEKLEMTQNFIKKENRLLQDKSRLEN